MFSVVIPLYNKAHTIKHTLDTVLAQTFTNFEVIIVNDGSTDNGVEVIESHFNDSRIKIIHQKNQGVSVARNNGVNEAKYEYIAFLDGDDEWLETYLEVIRSAINLYPNAGMYCTAGYIKDKNGKHIRLAKKYENKILGINYFENPQVFSHTSATIVKKSSFNKTSGFPAGMICNEDFALFYAIALTSSVIYIGKILSVYNGDIEGQITRISYEKRFELLKYVVDRYNLCYDLWNNSGMTNKIYLIFDKYETRARILGFLKRKDYKSLYYFIGNLDHKLKSHYLPFEFSMYKNTQLKYLSIIFIYVTKVIWRMHRFPVVGEN